MGTKGYLDDPTTAFLTELQNLLRKWNARITVFPLQDSDYELLVNVGDTELTFKTDLTPDNIFDYEK